MIDLKDVCVFVIGSDGFIGLYVVEELVKIGVCVKVVVYYNFFNFWGWFDIVLVDIMVLVEVVVGDICDFYFMIVVVDGCMDVLYFVVFIVIFFFYVVFDFYVEINVCGMVNVFQVVCMVGVWCFVQILISEVYGMVQMVLIKESYLLVG